MVIAMRLPANFERYYQANYGSTVALLTFILGSQSEAQDVTQQAFARSLTRWPKSIGDNMSPELIRRIALRISADPGRRAWRLIRPGSRPAEPGQAEPGTRLGESLARLPLRYRQILALHYVAGLPAEQIARERVQPVSAVSARLATARRLLGPEPDAAEREQLAARARPFEGLQPPDVSVIMRRARRRTLRQAGASVAILAVIGTCAFLLSS